MSVIEVLGSDSCHLWTGLHTQSLPHQDKSAKNDPPGYVEHASRFVSKEGGSAKDAPLKLWEPHAKSPGPQNAPCGHPHNQGRSNCHTGCLGTSAAIKSLYSLLAGSSSAFQTSHTSLQWEPSCKYKESLFLLPGCFHQRWRLLLGSSAPRPFEVPPLFGFFIWQHLRVLALSLQC